MRRWLRIPERIDVILPPRQWCVRRYARGLIIKATGHFQPDGTVLLDAFRLGPPAPRKGLGMVDRDRDWQNGLPALSETFPIDVDVSARDVLTPFHLNIRVVGKRRALWRVKAAASIIRVAAVVLGGTVSLEAEVG